MPDYQKGKIYTIRCRDDETLIYVGSSIQPLSVRWGGHKRNMLKKPHYPLYKNMLDKGVDMFYIELYETYGCNTKEELHRREGEVIREIGSLIREIGSLNKFIAGRTREERESTPEYIQKRREYRSTPEYKQKRRERQSTAEYKQKRRARESTDQYKQKRRARERRYRETSKKTTEPVSDNCSPSHQVSLSHS